MFFLSGRGKMQEPNEKKIHKLSPNILRESMCMYIEKVFGWKKYEEAENCPYCNSKDFYLHSYRERTFCTLVTENGFKEIKVSIGIFRCKNCGKFFKASNSPFYDGCKYGKPIVDLCLYMAASMPYNRVENVLMQFGIQVDRDTVKRYCQKFGRRAKKIAGIEFLGESVGINLLKILFNVENVEQLRKKYPDEKYDAVADETYPSIRGAKKKMKEENGIRKWNGKKIKRHPDGFCVATSYLPNLQLFASLICTPSPFNWLLAKLLFSPLLGATSICTDGNPSYKDNNPILCIVHRFRNLIKCKEIRELQRELHPYEFHEALHFIFEEFKREVIETLKEMYPDLVEEDEFIGTISTNAIEGGNWRIKWNLRTSYSNLDGLTGRILLILLMDTMYVFRNGKPVESFTHANSNFKLENIMEEKLPLNEVEYPFSFQSSIIA